LDSGDATAAASELETGVKLAPDSPEAHFALANAYAELGRKNDAVRQREEFRRLRKLIDSNQP
jgi:Tfp pilus assembly protein PilF